MNKRVEEKCKALSKYLNIDISAITVENPDHDIMGNTFDCEQGTFLVLDEEESEKQAKANIISDFDDLGLNLFTKQAQEYIITNCIDDYYFDDVCSDFYYNYCNDIQDEPDDFYESRLVHECIDEGVISEREIKDGKYTGNLDLVEKLSNKLYDNVQQSYGNFTDWYRESYSLEDLSEVITARGYKDINMDQVTEYCIEQDGYGHFISFYDGKTIELDNDLYAYKISD